jgi:pentatricopeptide repeat protein
MQTGKYQQAIENLQQVKYNTISYYNDIGLCYEMMGNESLAINNYKMSINVKDNSVAHYKIGYLLLKKGDVTGAINHLKQSVALNKNNTEAYKTLISAYKNQGNEVEALKVLQEYKETSSAGKAEEYFNAGVKAYQEQSYAAAIAAFEQSIAANPNNAISFVNLGFVQYDTGQTDKAFYSFQQALKLDANSSLAHYGIAMIYKIRGDSIVANTHWKRYLELEPTGYFSRQVKKELENK